MKADISIIQSQKGTEIAVSGNKINLQALVATFLFMIPAILLFRYIYGKDAIHITDSFFWLYVIAGIALNLLLHAFFFGVFSPKGFRSISLVMHKGCISFCHCNEAIRMWQYRFTCLLPVTVLGFLPLLYGMGVGNYDAALFGILMIIGGIDDLFILWKLRSFGNNTYINDCSRELRFKVW